MTKRKYTQLAIYQIKEETETVPIANLRSLYLEKASEIIYITREKKLYGVICLGDVLNHSQSGKVRINKTFTALTGYNLIKARKIFQRRANIHKIPIINDKGELLGDYSRWDDMLYIERNQTQLMKKDLVKKVLEPYEAIYVVEPIENENSVYLSLLEYLTLFSVKYVILKKEQVGEKLQEKSVCIFLNEEERRGVQCLYGVKLLMVDSHGNNIQQYDILETTCWNIRFATYKSLLLQIIELEQMSSLGIERPVNLPYHKIDDKASVFLSDLKRRGVRCFGVCSDEDELTEYGRRFQNEIKERLNVYPINLQEPWPLKSENEKFYDELYQMEDYEKEVVQKEVYYGTHSFEYRKDISGKYFNACNGRRKTCFQPEEYLGTIYLFGPCSIIGVYVEDQYTIASCLQKKMLEKGYVYRVENCGAMLRYDAAIDNRLEEIGEFQINDIVIYVSMIGKIVGTEGNSLEKIFETSQIPSEWVTDAYGHCNHKASQVIANGMLEMVESCLTSKMAGIGNNEKIRIDICSVMNEYVQHRYLNQFFGHFSGWNYGTVGAIVMNGNPFHKGHRYLIEQASIQVECLIIFVVEADEFLFSFEERINLIKEGTKDINNVIVVPSGDFVFSKNNFREYYTKRDDELAVLDAEYDLNIFAEYIAKTLHITHRFTGENSQKKVMKIYNEEMRKVLPQKGIVFVEIPRMEVQNEIVSTLKIQKYLKDEEYDKAFTMLPESTKQYLIEELDLIELDRNDNRKDEEDGRENFKDYGGIL